ncbi:hypothetical protein SLEP1_g25551 [Rubroshorea leprosula]|uniref:Reverse transcriptase domain-containing protein n=1 Tax=Rubroshorea leprosula TaxID=152421 RepID=A0AAV5JWR6_9ROSI|nr:hypothetical protein SLEP1_g25551 [Rubroshorea leprosula]
MKGLKSPRPDGIQPIFYQKHWHVVSSTLLSFVNKALTDGFFEHSLLQAHMILIPKGENPDIIQKFRPICLLNVAYKILSKVIVNRLWPHLQNLIGPLQNSFLAGRSTTDNIILSQEAIHSMHRMKGKKGAMAFKIDLHKAFDSVDWDFLREVLVDFNFPTPLIKLIMFFVTSLQLSVLWNGEELPYFQPQHGLRQGDPLSPYLFIMVMEKLSHMILSRVQNRLWKPFKASHSQTAVVMDCLLEFSSKFGLDINLAKSKLFISPNIQSHVANGMSSTCGIPLTSKLGVYLGVPIIHERTTSATYKYILEKFSSNWLAGNNLYLAWLAEEALIAKLGWQLLTGQNRPWCQALSQKYLRRATFMTCPVNSSSSATWRSILKCRNVLRLGARWRVGSGSSIDFWHDLWIGPQKLIDTVVSTLPPELTVLPVSHFITVDKQWDLSQLVDFLPTNILHSIAAIPLPTTNQLANEMFWHGSKNGDFTVSSAFSIIQSQRINQVQSSMQWTWIWKLKCSERIKLFVWLLRKGRVLTNSVRFDRHMAPSPMCPRLQSHSSGTTSTTWASLFLSMLWFLWTSRNTLILEWKWTSPDVVFWQARSHALETHFALNSAILASPRTPRWVCWQPPTEPFLKLNTNGSRNHQSGQACAGGLIRDHLGRWVHGFTVNIGFTSSFLAELWGCREGLKLAHSLQLQHLILEMDSLMAIQLIQTRQVEKGPFSVLLTDILVLLDAFSNCIVRHTLCEGNSAADFMASLGHKSPLGTTFYQNPPVGINMLMHGDTIGTMFLRP